MKPGMKLYFTPTGDVTECKSIEMHHTKLDEAFPGDNVGFNCKGINTKEVKKGHVVSDYNNKRAKVAKEYKAQCIFLGVKKNKNVKVGYCPVIDCHTSHIASTFKKFESKIDKRKFKVIEENPTHFTKGECGII
jgi:elongation factor 1-alpha